jgi:flagellar export protein FliJ
MSAQADRFDVVVKLADDAEREAAAGLAGAQARLAEASVRLGALEGYLRDYSERPDLAADTRPRSLADTRRFLLQLEQSVAAQSRVVTQEESRVQAARAHWVAARLKLDAMRRLVAERRETARLRREQVEQQQLDDRPAASAAVLARKLHDGRR